MAKETAEQKLLKLIEATEAENPGAAAPAADQPVINPAARETLSSVQAIGVSTIPVPPFIGELINMLRHPGQHSSGPREMGVGLVNKALLAAIVLIIAYFVSDFSSGMKAAQRPIQFRQPRAPESQGAFVSIADAIKDISQYVTVVSARNIFQPFERKVEEIAAAEAVPEPNQVINEKISTLKLVGISWLDSPDTVTVMIEDTETQVTHFLKRGDDLKGLVVDNIYTDRVDLSYQGETAMMKL